ncbi:MAG: DUF1963 domain-containing protein [Bacteroidaceae bacterium]|nr:DUF1963 domain-containing protein [Bacteroidaceae bacterium]
MPIRINVQPTQESLVEKSHWWGFPDLPVTVKWPENEEGELLTFICQVRLKEIAALDPEGYLPHEGMMWFFADMDYFLGDEEAQCRGIGEWEPGTYMVIYAKETDHLCTHEYYWEDGTLAVLEAERMTFEASETPEEFGFKLLGLPAMTEGYENENEGLVSLLQIDEEERWSMRFFDCGTINFMIPIEALMKRDFNECQLVLHSS